jgi:hypothetical protein
MNRWSARVPVELSNRELHREAWEHDGICLKVSTPPPPGPVAVSTTRIRNQDRKPPLPDWGTLWPKDITRFAPTELSMHRSS